VFCFSSRRRHTRWPRDWSSDVCSSDLEINRGESANQSTNQQRSIDFAKENTTPKADENGGVETMVTPKEDAERERRKSIRGDQRSEERRGGKEGRCSVARDHVDQLRHL